MLHAEHGWLFAEPLTGDALLKTNPALGIDEAFLVRPHRGQLQPGVPAVSRLFSFAVPTANLLAAGALTTALAVGWFEGVRRWQQPSPQPSPASGRGSQVQFPFGKGIQVHFPCGKWIQVPSPPGRGLG